MIEHIKRVTLAFILTFTCFLAPARQEALPNATISDLSLKNMDFAMNLYRRISSYHDKNIFFSPLSISTSFAALLMAADGVTREEILTGLNMKQLERANQPEIIPQLFQLLQENITRNGSLKLDQDMALFIRKQFNIEKTFEDQMKKYFNAEIKDVDFSQMEKSVSYINDYIMSKTKNRVKDMISSLDTQTQLMLIHTIFFRGNWKTPFSSNLTKMEPFYIDNYNVVQVQMMFKESKFYWVRDNTLGAKVLKLPYDQGVSMLILLPNKGVDYTVIDDEITAERFQGWIRTLRPIKIEVHLPKFKMEESYALHNLLPDMGVSSLFSNSANLTKLNTDKGLKVSEMLHKAVIEVDETGTTAAAATSTGITPYSLPPSFIADRPFFFFIFHEDTNALLFMGRVIDPTHNYN